MAASWPPSAATDATLSVAVNSLQTTLSGGISNIVTTIPLTSTTGFPTAGYVTIDNEVLSYTGVSGGTLTGAVRGTDGTSAAAHLSATAVSATIVAAHHNSVKDEIKAIETDLVNVIAAITPSAAASTATTLYNRFQHLTNQIKNGFGLTNWYDTVSAVLLKTGGTMSGAIAMGTNKITGLTAASASGDAVRYEQVNGQRILQIVQATGFGSFSTSLTTFQNTNITAAITPASASSKIFVFALCNTQNTASATAVITLARGGTNLGGTVCGITENAILNTATVVNVVPLTILYVDSPATTSPTTYTVQLRSGISGQSVYCPGPGFSVSDSNLGNAIIILVEVG